MTEKKMREIAEQLSRELGYRVLYEPGIEGAEVDVFVLDVPAESIIETCHAVHEFERRMYDGVCRGRISVMAYTPEETAVNFPEAQEDFISFSVPAVLMPSPVRETDDQGADAEACEEFALAA